MKRLAKALVIARIKENAKQKPHSWQVKPGPWDRKANGGRVASEKVLPPNHQLGMKVPEGGSSCSKCKFLATPTTCGNKGFIKWNGGAKLPAPSNEYCCDLYEVAKGYADGGRVHKDDGGDVDKPVFDPSQPFQAADQADSKPAFDPSQPFEAAPTGKSFGDRLSNMWDKATPGGPLWMAKQAYEGIRGAVQSSADAMSTPSTEADAFNQNQGRENGPGYAMQAMQVLTPGAPGGTGGILAAPLREAEKVIAPAVSANKDAAGEFGINLSRGQSNQDLDAIR